MRPSFFPNYVEILNKKSKIKIYVSMKPLALGVLQSWSRSHLKAKNIKYSNRSLLFANVHNIIYSAYKPLKQVRVHFLGQGIPIKKKISIYNLLPLKSAYWSTITQKTHTRTHTNCMKNLIIFIFNHILFIELFSNYTRKVQLKSDLNVLILLCPKSKDSPC